MLKDLISPNCKVPQGLNQGHYNSMSGQISVEDSVNFPPGTIVIRMAQPLANVAAYLLEPEADDGLADMEFSRQVSCSSVGKGI